LLHSQSGHNEAKHFRTNHKKKPAEVAGKGMDIVKRSLARISHPAARSAG